MTSSNPTGPTNYYMQNSLQHCFSFLGSYHTPDDVIIPELIIYITPVLFCQICIHSLMLPKINATIKPAIAAGPILLPSSSNASGIIDSGSITKIAPEA
jgi:hypothetical protein